MSTKTIYDMTPRQLEEQLVGKSITAIDERAITLGDGTTLEIQDTDDCCAWFNGEVRAIDLSDNVVTGVRHDERENADYLDTYTLTILSSVTELAAVDIMGDPTSGYYVHSVNLKVTTKETA